MSVTKEATDLYKISLPTPFEVGNVNVYLLKGDKLTLIDTGPLTQESWNVFTTSLSEIGYSPWDIEQVILTHHHPDHVGMLDYFPKEIPVFGHWRTDPWIKQEPLFRDHVNNYFSHFYETAGMPPTSIDFFKKATTYSCHRPLTNTLSEGDAIPGLPRWKVYEMPGHAQSHITLYEEDRKTLIGGDVLLGHISSNPMIEPPYIGEDERAMPQVEYNKTLNRLLEMEVSVVYAGHGNNVENIRPLLNERFKKQKDRAGLVLEMLKEKPQTAFEVCKQLFPKVYKKQLFLTLSETIGQLDFLEDLGDVGVEPVDLGWRYYARMGS